MRISDWSSDVCSSDLYGLTINPVLGIAACKNSFDIGFAGSGNGFNISGLVHIKPAFEDIGIGFMSNGHEKAGHIQYLFFPALVIHDPDPFDRLSVPDNFPGFGMKKDLNICRILYAVNHGFGCPELTLTERKNVVSGKRVS